MVGEGVTVGRHNFIFTSARRSSGMAAAQGRNMKIVWCFLLVRLQVLRACFHTTSRRGRRFQRWPQADFYTRHLGVFATEAAAAARATSVRPAGNA